MTLDQSGQPATAVGTHQLTIPLPQGLPPFPEKPYVLVVADPSSPSATADPQQTASFRTYTIGIVTHGGIQDTSWKHGPPWELQIAYVMKHEGYDAVIPYNWVAQSKTPARRSSNRRGWRGAFFMPPASSRPLPRSTSTSSATARERWSTPMPSSSSKTR